MTSKSVIDSVGLETDTSVKSKPTTYTTTYTTTETGGVTATITLTTSSAVIASVCATETPGWSYGK